MENRLFNLLLAAFFALSFLFSVTAGGFAHNVLAVIDLAVVFFALYEADPSPIPKNLITLDLGFLKGSEYLDVVALFTAAHTVGSLFSSGLFHFVLALLGVVVTILATRAAMSAADAEMTGYVTDIINKSDLGDR